MAIKRGMERGGRESVCVYVWVWEREWEGERGIERVCEGERKIIFSNLLPLFFPPSFLCFSLKLCGLWNSLFFLLVGKMETLRLSPGCAAGKDFSFLFSFFTHGSIFSFPPSTRHHPNLVFSLSLCLRFVPSGDLFFTHFLIFGVATRFDLICLVFYLQFPPNRSVPPAFNRGMETVPLFVGARNARAVGLG